DLASILHILENFILQSLALYVGHNRGADSTQVPIQQSLHDSLIEVRPSGLNHVFRFGVAVHVLNATANEGLVCFNFRLRTADLSTTKSPLLHRFTNAVKHEPCRLLSNAKSPRQFMGTNSVLA